MHWLIQVILLQQGTIHCIFDERTLHVCSAKCSVPGVTRKVTPHSFLSKHLISVKERQGTRSPQAQSLTHNFLCAKLYSTTTKS